MLQKSTDYDSELSDIKLSKEFDLTIKLLEEERLRFYKKSKGLFKRVFFRMVLVVSTTFIFLTMYFNDWKIEPPSIVGAVLFSSVVGLIFGGIYTLVRKGGNNHKFSRILKEKLVSKLVTHVNPDFNFFDGGITKEEFDKADLFPDGKRTSLTSEDKITGTIDGKKICFSECDKRGRASSVRGRTEIKIKGRVVSSSTGDLESNTGESVTYFDGLFFELELDKYNFSAPMKLIAKKKIRKEVETGVNMTGYVQKLIKTDEQNMIELPGEHQFQIYSSDKSQLEGESGAQLLKVADYIFDKYDKEGSPLLEVIPLVGKLPFFKDVKTSKSVFLSFVDNKMYLALEWPRDMFETDVFLKESLIESNIAQHMYEDILFINQVFSEMNLMNVKPE
jgi:hypothetical protein